VGFFSNVATRIRSAWTKDKERVALQLSRGATVSGLPSSGSELLQAYGYNVISDYLRMEQDLLSRFVDFEEMDEYPLTSAALNIFADDSTSPDTSLNRTMWVTSPDRTTRTTLDDLLYKRLRMDEEIWEIARTLCKYGNNMEELLVTPQGVVGLNFLPPPTVRRIEGPRGELFGFIQDFQGRFGWTPEDFKQILGARTAAIAGSPGQSQDPTSGLAGVTALEDWEVAHFRLRGKHRRSVYGSSILESSRWIWKRLVLLEDSALIYRLQRAPERFAFYVDVGDLPPAEALAYVNRVRQQYKKRKFVHPTSGKIDLQFNPLPVAHDTPVPLLDGRTITIKQMAEESAAGQKHWVYSVDRETGQAVPGEVSWVGQTRAQAPTLRVTFDDGGHLDLAPDHPVMLRNRSYVNAGDLSPGDSVMPFCRLTSSKTKDGYELLHDSELKRDFAGVVKVEKIDDADQFCMTVEVWHNFSACLRDEAGEVILESGVVIKNSQDEDFFLPTRQGQEGTKIDVLGAPQWQHMEDIQYFQNHLFAALSIPKAYLTYEETTARSILSSEDVRFARSVLRVQRELVNGMKKICRVHLAALGLDPYAQNYDIRMTVPSSIFELAQLEVRNARADLAGRMKDFVSLYWVYKNVFSMSDEDIDVLVRQREQDVKDQTVWAAKAEMEAQKIAQPPGGPAAGPPGAEPPGAGIPDIAVGGAPVVGSSRSRSNGAPMLSHRPRLNGGARGISERELFAGHRSDNEKRAEDRFEQTLRNDAELRRSLRDLQDMVSDLATVSKR
jgi:hypothetical protein